MDTTRDHYRPMSRSKDEDRKVGKQPPHHRNFFRSGVAFVKTLLVSCGRRSNGEVDSTANSGSPAPLYYIISEVGSDSMEEEGSGSTGFPSVTTHNAPRGFRWHWKLAKSPFQKCFRRNESPIYIVKDVDTISLSLDSLPFGDSYSESQETSREHGHTSSILQMPPTIGIRRRPTKSQFPSQERRQQGTYQALYDFDFLQKSGGQCDEENSMVSTDRESLQFVFPTIKRHEGLDHPPVLGVTFPHPASTFNSSDCSSSGDFSDYPKWIQRTREDVWECIEFDPLDEELSQPPAPIDIERTLSYEFWDDNSIVMSEDDDEAVVVPCGEGEETPVPWSSQDVYQQCCRFARGFSSCTRAQNVEAMDAPFDEVKVDLERRPFDEVEQDLRRKSSADPRFVLRPNPKDTPPLFWSQCKAVLSSSAYWKQQQS